MKRWIGWLLMVAGVAMLGGCAAPDGGAEAPSDPWVPDYRKSDKELVVLGFFGMSCRTCRSMGPDMGELYNLAEQRGLLSKIDFHVFGWKATPVESYNFRQRYQARYPVIADYDRRYAKRIGNVHPPMLVVFERRDGKLVEKTRLFRLRGDKQELLDEILR